MSQRRRPLSPEERSAYVRGYQTRADAWPLHKPPIPPHEVIWKLVSALADFIEEARGICQVFDEDDPLCDKLYVQIFKSETALSAISEWLRDEAKP